MGRRHVHDRGETVAIDSWIGGEALNSALPDVSLDWFWFDGTAQGAVAVTELASNVTIK